MNRRHFTQTLIDCREVSLVGGKAANLGELMRAGFPVPGGFVVTTAAYQELSPGAALSAEIAEEIRLAYRAMGGGSVAVRSSATAEDLADASLAGQCETYLDIQNEEELLDAVIKCWESLRTPRIQAYFREHGIDGTRVAMAVVVQRLVSADVAGVLFTTNPHDSGALAGGTAGTAAGGGEMLLEASWGLGESVVSGRVQPDVLRVEHETGRVTAAIIADKHVHLAPGARQERPVEESRRRQPCLREIDVQGLWALGKKASAHFGAPQDIEWAIHGGEIFLLQSRPITTLGDAQEYDRLLQETCERLRAEMAAGRGPWVLHNLAETLAHPTPLTWSVIRRFMSGSGGYGEMYRQAGFAPSERVNREGFLELIGGRIYMDAARAPEMFSESFPFGYDVEVLKNSPDAAQAAPTLPRGKLGARLKAGQLLAAVHAKLHAIADDLDRHLRGRLFPRISNYVADARLADLRTRDTGQLIERWAEIEDHVMGSLGPQLLMPSLISGMCLRELETFLADEFWDEDPHVLAQLISSGGPHNRTLIADIELHEVANGKRSLATWLSEHGHRGVGEFDLAAPRWREVPAAAAQFAARLAEGEDPVCLHQRQAESVDARIRQLARKLSRGARLEFEQRVNALRRYVSFREDGKDCLMLGYDLLRGLALEAGRRLGVGPDVFFLSREELFAALRAGGVSQKLIKARKARHRAEERLELPRVIDTGSIETLGKPPSLASGGDGWEAYAVSTGRAIGPAKILQSPMDTGELERGYILVCPSTDPSWTPLFINAAGLVLERGGALSHGAVVAREMGLPAVVLPGATKMFKDGERIVVEGQRGWVAKESPGSGEANISGAAVDARDVRVANERIPPGAGRKDRRAGRVRNILALFWIAYLAAFFLLPARWVYDPTMAVLDGLLWPLVRAIGKPGTVALAAAAIAIVTLLLQKYMTGNERLLAAKRRAAALQKEAAGLPKDSPRRAALLRYAAPVTARSLAAAMVPVGILLGPLVLPFTWFSQRVDPAAWSAPAGSAVQVVAMVESNFAGVIKVEAPVGIAVDEATPAMRTLPPIRRELERLLALYRQPRNDAAGPWELKVAPDARQHTADDLQAYLAAGIPPQGITWMLRPDEYRGGRIPVKVAAADHAPVVVNIVLGDDVPPMAQSATGLPGSPVREVRVVYPKPKAEPVFWRPFGGSFGVSWLWLYVLVYVPTLLLARALLGVA